MFNVTCCSTVFDYHMTNTIHALEFEILLCLEINGCSVGSHNCHPNATCTDLVDGFNCTCNEFFIGDGTNCSCMLKVVIFYV